MSLNLNFNFNGKDTLSSIELHQKVTSYNNTYSPKLIIDIGSFDNQIYETMIHQFKIYLNKPTKSNFMYFKNIGLITKEYMIVLLNELTEKDYNTICNLISSDSIEESDQAIEFIIKSLECCPSVIDVFSKYNFPKLCYECLPQKRVVDTLKLFASINRNSLIELDFDFLKYKMNTYNIIYEKLSILVSCLQVFFEANIIDDSYSEMFLLILSMKIQNFLTIGEELQDSILSLFSILENSSHLAILTSNNIHKFLMQNFTIFPKFEQRLLILKIIQNLVQEQFIENLFESNILYFINIVYYIINQKYIHENKSLPILSLLILIATKIVQISSKCRKLLSDSDFTQNLRIAFYKWPYSHKIEIFKYVSSYINFIDEEFSYNLIISFDIIPFLTEILYTDNNDILEMTLCIFMDSLNYQKDDNIFFQRLREIAFSDEFHSIISQLCNEEDKQISNLSRNIQNILNNINV